jgi:hypothetical protein
MNDPTPAPVDFIRDQWGRPLVVPAGGDRPRPYTRSSSAAKTIEDTYNLELWARRNVAFGMARDASLVARVLAAGGDPSRWDTPAKRAVDRIVEDASTIAQAHKGADIGTALHRLTELVDRDMDIVAGPYEADVNAYVNALIDAGLTVDPRYVECRLVCDALEMAGTADRLLQRADGTWVVADLKTGATVDYGALGWSAQLAAYAHSDLYDPETTERMPTPPLDKVTGIIIHLPAGQGTCTLYELDLAAGYRAAVLANEVRAVRRAARRWITALPTRPEPQPVAGPLRFGGDEGPTVTDEQLAQLRDGIAGLSDDDRAVLNAIAAEAHATVGSISAKVLPSRRRWLIARGLVRWMRHGWDEDVVRAALAHVTGDPMCHQPMVSLGVIVGLLTIDQAEAFVHMALGISDGLYLLNFDDQGTPSFAEAT